MQKVKIGEDTYDLFIELDRCTNQYHKAHLGLFQSQKECGDRP